MARTCRICGRAELAEGLDLGPQPISNRFKQDLKEADFRAELEITACLHCGLVQLAKSFPADEIRPRLAWMKYREREDHLEAAMASFAPLMGGLTEARALGITDFDGVLAEVLKKRVSLSYAQISPANDLEIGASTFGMETFQVALTEERARRLVAKAEKCGVLISRYLFEHAEKPVGMLGAYGELLTDGGFLILEIPDAEGPLERCDYPMIWEEHNSYFTEQTLRRALENNGFAVRSVFRAESKFEQPLLVLAQKGGGNKAKPDAAEELARFEKFRKSFDERRRGFREFCQRARETGATVALFGAGHFTVAVVNFLGLEEYVEFVVDDDANKKGLFLAGTSLPIVSSEALRDGKKRVVLLCVNPDVEARLMEKLKGFIREGEEWYSIFAASPRFCLHA